MKLAIKENFTIEVPKADGTEEIIKGTYRILTKAELKQIKEEFKESKQKADNAIKLTRNYNRLINKQKLFNLETSHIEKQSTETKILELEEQLEDLQAWLEENEPTDKAIRKRLEFALDAECQDQIFNLCETFGYQLVVSTIEKDINEKKPKDTKN